MDIIQRENISVLHKKIPWVIIVFFIFYASVVARLYYLQIIEYQYYDRLSTDIVLREDEIVARRGNIVDRNGIVIASDRLYHSVALVPQFIDNASQTIDSLAQVISIDQEKAIQKYKANHYLPPFLPREIIADADFETIAHLSEFIGNGLHFTEEDPLRGVVIRTMPIRYYLYPDYFAHVLGYMREIDKDHLGYLKESTYKELYSLGDLVGASGLERQYDVYLKGYDGVKAHVVDAKGREIVGLKDVDVIKKKLERPARDGYTLVTALDFYAQQSAADAMKGQKGAVVAMNPQTGEVLVLYSAPTFDGNRITKVIDKEYWKHINLDSDRFLFNRALQAMYPPASTYKPMVLAAGIDKGVIKPDRTKYACGGGVQFGNRFFKCWSKGHGIVDAVKSLAQSCDVFYYRVGMQLGVDGIAEYANVFGYGQKTGIDLPFEKSGLVPTKEWKQKRHKQAWVESETLSVAIGQSYDLATPLQSAVATALIANGGYHVVPQVAKEILSADGRQVIKKMTPMRSPTAMLHSEALEWAKKGMIEVVQGAGTARKLKQNPYRIAGKTGTAQVIGHDSRVKMTAHTENHALFNAFAPYDDPQIVVSVIVENGK